MMTTPNDLERRLRADMTESVSDVHADMFTVNRLIETAKHDAPTRTSRRIWIAPLLAAAAVVAVAVATTAVVSQSSNADRHKPTPVPPIKSMTSSVPTPRPGSVSVHVLGPNGLGALRLGMTRSQAMATGVLSSIGPAINGGCALIHIAGKPSSAGGDGYLSPTLGIVSIWPAPSVRTPEGIGVGSTIAEVKQAYPSVDYSIGSRQDGGPRVPVPGNADAKYYVPVDNHGKVRQLGIALQNQDCFS